MISLLPFQDLLSCSQRLVKRESELLAKIRDLTGEAMHRKHARDLNGAKKKLVERKRTQMQLEKLSNSMSIVDMHINTIEVLHQS